MGKLPSLGIRRIEAIHYYVRDLERSRRFYTERLDFTEIACSDDGLVEQGRQRSLVFEAGGCRVVCSTPEGSGGRAGRYLEKHPDGVGSIVFEVENVERAFALLDVRGGTMVDDIRTVGAADRSFKTFVMTTPFGDTTFRFVERGCAFGLYPWFRTYDVPRGGSNAFGFLSFDHVTSNFETMSPALLWMEHVLGFERFWNVEFHTNDVRETMGDAGSGLRSVVMWDPASGVKFANNEPRRPNFKVSQVNLFHEQHRGDGVQHAALSTGDIVSAVRKMRQRGVAFVATPAAYYDALPERLSGAGIGALAESLDDLRQLELLVDGDGPGRYLLQIFLKDSAGVHGCADCGPFFFEVIERRGDQGFGAGNFRALFESIERQQRAEERR
ncbi:MAG: VOC family protein [Polyangiaceae bacterium]|jgi:4-hydroxyphenylpyruvate dioxygenase